MFSVSPSVLNSTQILIDQGFEKSHSMQQMKWTDKGFTTFNTFSCLTIWSFTSKMNVISKVFTVKKYF